MSQQETPTQHILSDNIFPSMGYWAEDGKAWKWDRNETEMCSLCLQGLTLRGIGLMRRLVPARDALQKSISSRSFKRQKSWRRQSYRQGKSVKGTVVSHHS